MPLTITNNTAYAMRYVEWGLESRWYDDTTSLLLDSDSLTPSASATSTTRTGAYDPNATGPNVIRATLATQTLVVCSTGNQSHVGTFRVKARVWVAAATTGSVMVRLAYQAGDGPMRPLRWTTPPVVNNWAEVELGLISIPTTQGTQRWTGQVQAYSTTIGETVDVDVLTLVPAERYGIARAEYTYRPGVGVARDEFTSTTAGGSLNARVAPAGGTWTTSSAATDFAFTDTGGERVVRSTVSEGSPRYAILGSTSYTDTEVSVAVEATAGVPEAWVIARYVDASNFLLAGLQYGGEAWRVAIVVGGATSQLGIVPWTPRYNERHTLRLVVYPTGQLIAQLLDSAGVIKGDVRASHTALATGGALASGKPGIADQNPNSAASSRYYDEFYAATPAAEPVVMYPGQSMQISSTSTLREDATGVYWGNAPSYVGGRFYVPPAGGPGRKSRVVVRARRNDIVTAADDQIADSMTVAVSITPRYLVVPR